ALLGSLLLFLQQGSAPLGHLILRSSLILLQRATSHRDGVYTTTLPYTHTNTKTHTHTHTHSHTHTHILTHTHIVLILKTTISTVSNASKHFQSCFVCVFGVRYRDNLA